MKVVHQFYMSILPLSHCVCWTVISPSTAAWMEPIDILGRVTREGKLLARSMTSSLLAHFDKPHLLITLHSWISEILFDFPFCCYNEKRPPLYPVSDLRSAAGLYGGLKFHRGHNNWSTYGHPSFTQNLQFNLNLCDEINYELITGQDLEPKVIYLSAPNLMATSETMPKAGHRAGSRELRPTCLKFQAGDKSQDPTTPLNLWDQGWVASEFFLWTRPIWHSKSNCGDQNPEWMKSHLWFSNPFLQVYYTSLWAYEDEEGVLWFGMDLLPILPP